EQRIGPCPAIRHPPASVPNPPPLPHSPATSVGHAARTTHSDGEPRHRIPQPSPAPSPVPTPHLHNAPETPYPKRDRCRRGRDTHRCPTSLRHTHRRPVLAPNRCRETSGREI